MEVLYSAATQMGYTIKISGTRWKFTMQSNPKPATQGQQQEESKEEPDVLRIQVEMHEINKNHKYIVSVSTKDRPTTFGYKEFNETFKKFTESMKEELTQGEN